MVLSVWTLRGQAVPQNSPSQPSRRQPLAPVLGVTVANLCCSESEKDFGA